ncbi:uncharacterized protein AMSG_05628 [Thecamonas trahens ATCC 50062]|uniref:Uncharacterized protein n=1 Tax=Thecamonas trahens ATCC 50062 TaxID=461836 RepID=A0A0L0DB81_THETB|nr:hypothetical protein AMSG_05628 [Thecamonas trahens ATCC 50062]KNC49589.1 hypothetical protein AMSG_05628 [Thecamonas trahens ATCC 50062]|eukprot:XP_013757697.1 hypothetical protein AMSG_05628 [Thecamonas trahens ATCC 50062]
MMFDPTLSAASSHSAAALEARTAAVAASAAAVAKSAKAVDVQAANAVADILALRSALAQLPEVLQELEEASARMTRLAATVAAVDAALGDVDAVVLEAESQVMALASERDYARYVRAREDALARVEAQLMRVTVQREAASLTRLAIETESERRKLDLATERARLEELRAASPRASPRPHAAPAAAAGPPPLSNESTDSDDAPTQSGLAPPPRDAIVPVRTARGMVAALPSFSTVAEEPLTLSELGAAKAECIAREAFLVAKVFKQRAEAIAAVEADKAQAVAAEDFDAALAAHERLSSLTARMPFLEEHAEVLEYHADA